MRVFQLSEDKTSLVFKCPRCGETLEKTLAELEEERRIKDEEAVAESALDEATSS